jgi:hypothetical protein
MSSEHDPLTPVFAWRLTAALDRVTPPLSLPRYASVALRQVRPWRVAPFLVAAAMAVLLALTATATTGSPNPIVWTRDAASTIQSVGHTPDVIPSPQPAPEQAPPKQARSSAPAAPAPVPTPQTQHQHGASPSPNGSEQSDDSQGHDFKESSLQWSGHWGSGTTTSTASGSPRHPRNRDDQ